MKPLSFISVILVLVTIFSFHNAQTQTIDPTFSGLITAKTKAMGSILFPDGKYILYGDFVRVNGQNMPGIAKFNADGSIDNTFVLGTGPNDVIFASAVQTDGKIILAGRFTVFNGVNRVGMVRLNTDGSIDNTFTPNLTLAVGNLEGNLMLQPDGKVLVTGPYPTADGVSTGSSFMVRLNTDGSRDATFSVSVNFVQISDIALQSDQKIIIGGNFTQGIARLNSNGTVDGTFSVGTGFDSWVVDVEVSVVSGSDRIIAAGYFTHFNGAVNFNIAALTTSGLIDATFQANGKLDGVVSSIRLQADGKLLVTGFFSHYNVTNVKAPIRLNTDGTLDGTLNVGTGANFGPELLTSNTSSGDILVTADPSQFTTFNGQSRNGIAIVSSTGSLKPMTQPLNLQAKGAGYRVLAQGSDKILLSHQANEVNGNASVGLERLNLDGTTDGTFSGSSKPNNFVNPIALDHNGMILIGGSFTAFNGTATGHFARLSSAGVLDNTFTTNNGTGFNSDVYSIVEQPDGKILVGGAFTSFNGTLRKGIARLNANGTMDAAFNTVNGFITSTGGVAVHDIEVLSNGKILVAGLFNSFDGNAVKGLIRLNADGSFDNSFLIGTGAYNNEVMSVEVLINGKILIGGGFTFVNGTPTNYIALLNSDGTLDTSSSLSGYFIVDDIKKESNGKILIADRNKGVTRLNPDGTVDNTFTPLKILLTDNSLAYFGNSIVSTGVSFGQSPPGIVKISLPVTAAPSNLAVQTFAATQVSFTWTDNSNDEAGFEIYRSTTNNSSYTLVQTLAPNATGFTDTGLSTATSYYYKVRAINLNNNSSYSNEVSQLTTPADWTGPIAASLAGRSDGVAVMINGKAYVGLGQNGTGLLKDWWEFNPSNNAWTQKLDFPGTARIGAVAFVVNGKGYVGTGNDQGGGGFKQDFYEYDATANTWTPKANFPADVNSGAGITSGVAFAISNFGYVGLGNTGANNTQAFYKFDPVVNSWQSIANFPASGRTGAIGFAANGLGYAGFGFGSLSPNRNDLWQYDPTANQWTAKTSYTGAGRGGAAVTVIGGEAFLFAGTENTTGTFGADTRINTVVSYSTLLDQWNPQLAIPASVRTGAVAFSANTTAYVFGGYNYVSGNVYLSDLYSFAPPSTFLPASPTGVQATLLSQTQVQCTWVDNSIDETGFTVEYAVGSSSTYSVAATVPAGTTTYTHTGLIADTQYKYRITATNAYGNSLPSSPATVFTTLPPTSPTNLTATALSVSSISLSWTDNSSNETGFEIYRSTPNNSSYALVHTSPANANTYTDTGLSAITTYFYKIKAINAGGFSFSNEISKATLPFPPTIPSSLTAQVSSNTQIVLNWVDLANNETGFEVYRSVSNNTGYSLIQTTAPNTTSFTDTGLTPATLYYYKVRSINIGGASLYSNEVSKTTFPDPPVAPSNLSIQSFTSTQIVLSWTDNSTNETGFEIYRSVSNNLAYSLIVTLGSNTTSFTNIGLTPGVTYFYQIRAQNTGGFSAYSNEISQTTVPDPPVAPSNLSVSNVQTTQIGIYWTDNSNNETGFEVYRSVSDNSSYVLLTTTIHDNANFIDTGLSPGTTYYYKVRAVNGTASAFSNEISQATLPNPPLTPSNLAIQSFTTTQIVISWVDNSDNETGFEIYRSTSNNSNYSRIISIMIPNATTFTDTPLSPVTTYFYKIKAINSGGVSAFSNEISQTTLADPVLAPSNLSLNLVSTTQATLNWTDNSTNETGFEIYKSVGGNTSYTLIQTTSTNSTTYSDNSLSAGNTYYFKVRAVNQNQASSSPYSLEVSTVITGVEKISEIDLAVSPNPAHGELMVKNNSDNLLKFGVYNSLGQQVLQDEVYSNDTKTIPCSNWSPGVYVIVVPSIKVSRKIIKD